MSVLQSAQYRLAGGVPARWPISAELLDALLHDVPLAQLVLLPHHVVMQTAANKTCLSVEDALTVVVSYLAHLAAQNDYTEETVLKASGLQARFAAYVQARYAITQIDAVGRDEVLAWINSRDGRMQQATRSTKDNRRWALALFFRTLRALNLYGGDPLLDVAAFARSPISVRPLLDWEMDRCRQFSRLTSVDETLGPVRVALAQATATAGEIAAVVPADVDLDQSLVWLTGVHCAPRWGSLTSWGAKAVAARLRDLSPASSMPIAYEGRGAPGRGTSSVCMGLHRIIRAAALGEDNRIKPGSIRAGAARKIWADTRDIHQVADGLGLRSLDGAWAVIQVVRERPEEAPPAHRRP